MRHLVFVKAGCRFIKAWVSRDACRGDLEGGRFGRHRGSPKIFRLGGFSGIRALLARRVLNAPADSTAQNRSLEGLTPLEGVGCFLEALPETEAAASARRV